MSIERIQRGKFLSQVFLPKKDTDTCACIGRGNRYVQFFVASLPSNSARNELNVNAPPLFSSEASESVNDRQNHSIICNRQRRQKPINQLWLVLRYIYRKCMLKLLMSKNLICMQVDNLNKRSTRSMKNTSIINAHKIFFRFLHSGDVNSFDFVLVLKVSFRN